ncbi:MULTISPECIES: EamA family transporter [Mesorhizobium]|uniref:Drug/metabolite transporter (DMT)-like permease n=1 Tax=Mesorhizobium shonense TaxID=1209948 RepID=A0ABV2HNK7_9HYPH|nr:EamA family transporter [Mesorhizobium sp.]RWB23474.1 MAG: EamA family transporter [Mesorhizobium sp.]RWE01273.1 MAG: EamA family transporter [Mesorhizobium sp.]TIS51387.1 MAG: EamA family transporter [Mesorhizobium sp.]
MTLFVFLAVLSAAAMHAIWNALVKVHLDRFLSITLMTLGMGFAALLVLPFVEIPKAEVWPFILASVFFHMGYRTFLISAYKAGDFAQTYPLARGTAPLLSALGAIVLVGEVPAPLAIVGIVLLSIGTFVMSFRGGVHLERFNLRAVGFALGTSIFIASYTLSDGSGARLAATAQSYAAWLFVCDAAWALVLCVAFRGPQSLPMLARDWKAGLFTGVLSGSAYWIVMWAMTKAPIASVASLRETSILFAMLISVLALGEKMTAWRATAALGIVAGVVALRLG